jgi:hypothetical protein
MIELADVVSDLRKELDRARHTSADEELRFELGPIELEVSVGLSKEGGAAAKVRFWVVDMGVDMKASSMSTQRIKLTLHPALPGQEAASRIAGGSVYIHGDEFDGER